MWRRRSRSRSQPEHSLPKRPGPVSYTHLDVYKRQVVIGGATFALGASRRSTTRESVQNTPGGSERVVEQHDVMTSVSYTHLDVYKRQVVSGLVVSAGVVDHTTRRH